ncbi:hypothetical protein H5410_061044 [Solanum commersonii]|uniref:Movement protein n=1 Tax=Solanum commersonii TaxID=4109 RepID=A0A9J5W8D7_SOLCO|nr:hypothetical protein H5410_061044 [Solanum commersonii]
MENNQHTLNIVNFSSQPTKIAELQNDLQNWNIPEEPFKKIHHLGNLCLITRHNIKTRESTIAINNTLEIIRLLKDSVNNGYRTDFNYLHIGLVQVVSKPLFRKGLAIPVCVLLQDDRFLNFYDSLLGVLQSNLVDGPIYFNCYPNFFVDNNDPNVIDSLTLNIKSKNFTSKANTREIVIIYRVYYRLMKTTLAPKAHTESQKGVTMLMEANHQHSTIFIPRLLNWNDVLSSNDGCFESITQPFSSHSERSQIERVIQFPDGSIELKFLDNSVTRSSSHRRLSWSSSSTSCPSRRVPRPISSSKISEEAEAEAIPIDNNKGKVT